MTRCAHAWVQNVDGRICEAVGYIKLLTRDVIHSCNHIGDNFRRRIPDTEFLPEFGVECFKKGFVEVLDGALFFARDMIAAQSQR